MNHQLFDFLLRRQSTGALTGPGPALDEIRRMVEAASAAPDHGRLRPYRFVVIDSSAKERFADALVEAVDSARGGISDELKAKIRKKTEVAPVQVALLMSPRDTDRIPLWEQFVTASCSGYGLVLAAQAAGWGVSWRSNPVMEGELLDRLLNLQPGEQFLGWINMGTVAATPAAGRAGVDADALVSVA